jgi:hyperosmotically inducible periplasmic protein
MKLTHIRIAVLAAAAFTSSLPLLAAGNPGSTSEQLLATQVRQSLNKLPYYSVFDHLTFSIKGTTVTLTGDVTRPWLKTQAEKTVKSLNGVETVASTINVLPLSPFDDRIRLAVLRNVYGQTALNKYANITAPIRIIVRNGEVTLEGVVLNDGDRSIANIQANSVPGVFHVNNKLQLEGDVI